jgi:hypothetical protein
LDHLFTHLRSLIHSEARCTFGEGDAIAAVAQFLLIQSFGISLLCSTPRGGVLPWYGAIVVAMVVFLVDLAFVIGFI